MTQRTYDEWHKFFDSHQDDLGCYEPDVVAKAIQREQLNEIINWLETWSDDPVHGKIIDKVIRQMTQRFKP